MPTVLPPDSPSADVDALIGRVGELERTQRREDVDGFLDLFDTDAVWVTGGGRRLIGIDEIANFTRQVLPGGMQGGSVSYRVDHISFVRPDVALTGVHQQYLDAEGREKEGQIGSPTYLWSRTASGWKIVAGQNTAVVE